MMSSTGRVPPDHLNLFRMSSSATETCLDKLGQSNSRRGSVISVRRASELPSPRKSSINMLTTMVKKAARILSDRTLHDHRFLQARRFQDRNIYIYIHRWLSRSRQLGGLVPVFRLGVPLRCKASKLEYPLRIPPLIKKRTLV